MPIEGLEYNEPAHIRQWTRVPGTGPLGPACPRLGLSGQISILSGNQYLGKKWLPFPVTPKEITEAAAKRAQRTLWDMFISSIKKKLGL